MGQQAPEAALADRYGRRPAGTRGSRARIARIAALVTFVVVALAVSVTVPVAFERPAASC